MEADTQRNFLGSIYQAVASLFTSMCPNISSEDYYKPYGEFYTRWTKPIFTIKSYPQGIGFDWSKIGSYLQENYTADDSIFIVRNIFILIAASILLFWALSWAITTKYQSFKYYIDFISSSMLNIASAYFLLFLPFKNIKMIEYFKNQIPIFENPQDSLLNLFFSEIIFIVLAVTIFTLYVVDIKYNKSICSKKIKQGFYFFNGTSVLLGLVGVFFYYLFLQRYYAFIMIDLILLIRIMWLLFTEKATKNILKRVFNKSCDCINSIFYYIFRVLPLLYIGICTIMIFVQEIVGEVTLSRVQSFFSAELASWMQSEVFNIIFMCAALSITIFLVLLITEIYKKRKEKEIYRNSFIINLNGDNIYYFKENTTDCLDLPFTGDFIPSLHRLGGLIIDDFFNKMEIYSSKNQNSVGKNPKNCRFITGFGYTNFYLPVGFPKIK